MKVRDGLGAFGEDANAGRRSVFFQQLADQLLDRMAWLEQSCADLFIGQVV
jgi:hypothetical protein